MTARHAVSCSIFLSEIRHRPNGVQLWLNADGQIGAPCVTISMNLLSCITRVNLNRLGEVQRDLAGERLQKRLCSIKCQFVNNQIRQVADRAASAPVRFVALPEKSSRPMGVRSINGMTSALN